MRVTAFPPLKSTKVGSWVLLGLVSIFISRAREGHCPRSTLPNCSVLDVYLCVHGVSGGPRCEVTSTPLESVGC